MTPDELAAIEARDAEWSDVADTPDLTPIHLDRHEGATHKSGRSCEKAAIVDRRALLAALRTEQEARARVEAAARGFMRALWDGDDRPDDDPTVTEWRDALRAALAPDASEGGER